MFDLLFQGEVLSAIEMCCEPESLICNLHAKELMQITFPTGMRDPNLGEGQHTTHAHTKFSLGTR